MYHTAEFRGIALKVRNMYGINYLQENDNKKILNIKGYLKDYS